MHTVEHVCRLVSCLVPAVRCSDVIESGMRSDGRRERDSSYERERKEIWNVNGIYQRIIAMTRTSKVKKMT